MTTQADFLLLLSALALAAYTCRASGFWIMRFIVVTPRLEAALKAAPLAVMVGIVAPAAVRGGVPEIGGLLVVVLVMRWRGNDLIATLAGVLTVAILRMLLR